MKGKVSGVTFSEYPYERHELKTIVGLLDNPKTIIDIGANIGWYSMCLADTFPKASIHAFEPIPETFKFLTRNIKNNKFNVSVYPYALSSIEGTVTFNYLSDIPGASTMVKNGNVKVKTLLLDGFDFEDVDFIKIDTEGSELMVLEGAIDTIIKYKPLIMCEMLRKWTKRFNYTPNDIIEFMERIGYKCYTMDLKPFRKMTDKTKDTNFLFI
jgi:FkbM family methyltransferase